MSTLPQSCCLPGPALGHHRRSAPVSSTLSGSPHPYDRGALGQSFLRPGLLLPPPCFLRFSHDTELISEHVSSGPNLWSRWDRRLSVPAVCYRQGDWPTAGLREPAFVRDSANKFQVKMSFTILLALECEDFSAVVLTGLPGENASILAPLLLPRNRPATTL